MQQTKSIKAPSNKGISYATSMFGTTYVFLDGKRVGSIQHKESGYQYFPKNSREGGEVFSTLADCKRSLE